MLGTWTWLSERKPHEIPRMSWQCRKMVILILIIKRVILRVLTIIFIVLLLLTFCYRVKSKEDQYQKFWEQGDFGYLSARTESLDTICSQEKQVSTFVNRVLCSEQRIVFFARSRCFFITGGHIFGMFRQCTILLWKKYFLWFYHF